MYRVLRIANRLNLGGPTYNVAYLSRYLNENFETLLVAGNTDDTEESSEFIVESLGLKPRYITGMYRELHPLKDIRAYNSLKEIIREYKPHIVHTHAAKAGALGRLVAWQEKVPVIVHTFHGHIFHSYFSPAKTRIFLEIERFLAKKTTRIIALSDIQKDELSQQFNVAPPDKFSVIPLGFDLQKFTENTATKRASYRSKYQIADDEIAIGIIGRLVPVKNHRFFLEVIRAVRNRTDKRLKVLVIGDGEERSRIETMATEMNIPFTRETDNVHDQVLIFTSWEKQVDVALAGLDIVTLTSLNEGTPVSLIEASAAGKAVVTTDVGGIRNVLEDGKNAFILHKEDRAGFAEKLLMLIEDPQLLQRMGQHGSEETLKKYSYQRLCANMRELYYELLKEKNL